MVRDCRDSELVTNQRVDDPEGKMLHNETTLAIPPLASKARMLQQEIEGMLKLRQQGLRQSQTGIVAIELSLPPAGPPEPRGAASSSPELRFQLSQGFGTGD
jgi:hypothetical protein